MEYRETGVRGNDKNALLDSDLGLRCPTSGMARVNVSILTPTTGSVSMSIGALDHIPPILVINEASIITRSIR
jgi:hypothetical protein